MNNLLKLNAFLIFTICLVGCSFNGNSGQKSSIVLVRAHIIKSFDPGDNDKIFNDDGSAELSHIAIDVNESLIGFLKAGKYKANLWVRSWPESDELKNIYLLAKINDKKELDVITWNFVDDKICIDSETAKKLNIENELLKLNARGVISCESGDAH